MPLPLLLTLVLSTLPCFAYDNSVFFANSTDPQSDRELREILRRRGEITLGGRIDLDGRIKGNIPAVATAPEGGWQGPLLLSDILATKKQCGYFFHETPVVKGRLTFYAAGWMCRNRGSDAIEDVYGTFGISGCFSMAKSYYNPSGTLSFTLMHEKIDMCDVALMAATSVLANQAASLAVKVASRLAAQLGKMMAQMFSKQLAMITRFTSRKALQSASRIGKKQFEKLIRKNTKGQAKASISAMIPEKEEAQGMCETIAGMMNPTVPHFSEQVKPIACVMDSFGLFDKHPHILRKMKKFYTKAQWAEQTLTPILQNNGVTDAGKWLSDYFFFEYKIMVNLDMNSMEASINFFLGINYNGKSCAEKLKRDLCDKAMNGEQIFNSGGQISRFFSWMNDACQVGNDVVDTAKFAIEDFKHEETMPIMTWKLGDSSVFDTFSLIGLEVSTITTGTCAAITTKEECEEYAIQNGSGKYVGTAFVQHWDFVPRGCIDSHLGPQVNTFYNDAWFNSAQCSEKLQCHCKNHYNNIVAHNKNTNSLNRVHNKDAFDRCPTNKFGLNFCNQWCNNWWGCGVGTLVGADGRNTANVDFSCSCAGCNGCADVF